MSFNACMFVCVCACVCILEQKYNCTIKVLRFYWHWENERTFYPFAQAKNHYANDNGEKKKEQQ